MSVRVTWEKRKQWGHSLITHDSLNRKLVAFMQEDYRAFLNNFINSVIFLLVEHFGKSAASRETENISAQVNTLLYLFMLF